MTKLYCFQHSDSMNNLIAILHFGYKEVVLIEDQRDKPEYVQDFTDYLKSLGLKVTIDTLNLYDTGTINKYLEGIQLTDSHFILPVGGRVLGYQMLSVLLERKARQSFVEDDGDIYDYIDAGFKFISDATHINVEGFILSRGGSIKSHATSLFDKANLYYLLDYIEKNKSLYDRLFRSLANSTPFYQSDIDRPSILTFDLNVLSSDDQASLMTLVNLMKEKHLIRHMHVQKKILTTSFKSPDYKSYLLKTGTWLEHRLYLLLKGLNVSDVEGSLSFIWDKKRKANNECDVIGVYNNQLIMASCKDTNHVTPEYINEIYTNAMHLGNETAIKLLFTTADIPASLQDKANEFGVHLLHYNFHIDSALKSLKNILKQH